MSLRTPNFRLGGRGVLTTLMLAATLAMALLGLVVFTSPAKAQSNVITVNTTVDETTSNDGCSLREALTNANDNRQTFPDCAAGSGADTINFDLGPSATITLSSALPQITDLTGLTIDGGSASITISGNNKVQVFVVIPSAKLTIQALTVTHGNGPSSSIANSGGTLNVTNSTLSGNSSPNGGGIENDAGGTLNVTNSTFFGNSTGAGGGGISNGGTLNVTNSTFFGNSAGAGGGISNNGILNVTNSTFSDNSAINGGGINNEARTANLRNTILAQSTNGNCFGTITDNDYNIADDNSCNFTASHSKNTTDPLFAGGLADNGGPTQTIALQPSSPAVDAIPPGTNGCGTDITTDQRGVSRPHGSGCDIGAFELNRAPLANDDSYSTDEDKPLNVDAGSGVLKNDTDPDGDKLTAVKVSDPTHGTLTLNPDGSFSYTPNADFSGTDSFTYKANDGTTDSSPATVTITVNPVNQQPNAVDDSYSIDQDQSLDVPAPGVLSNDTDPQGDSLTALKDTDPAHGTLTLNSDGSFSYTPTAGFSGSDSFTYTAQDASAHTSNPATVGITVNSAPPATSPGSSCKHHRPHKHPHHKHIHHKHHHGCGK